MDAGNEAAECTSDVFAAAIHGTVVRGVYENYVVFVVAAIII
jgi:hypothetical protein